MQGCPLRCACCHNPDTWDLGGGKIVSAEEIFRKIQRLRAYFGKDGGVTVSGGEPLLQADFVAELFSLCRADGISCALDTSGCVYNESVERLLSLTDLVLLDYKYTSGKDYKKYTGMSMQTAEDFLERLDALGKRVWIRQVIIPTLNDSEESVRRLYALSERYSCIEKTELLPFRKLCVEKYRALGIDFPLEKIPEASEELIERLKRN
jgi:pyruvate formate lyase activating enzyme